MIYKIHAKEGEYDKHAEFCKMWIVKGIELITPVDGCLKIGTPYNFVINAVEEADCESISLVDESNKWLSFEKEGYLAWKFQWTPQKKGKVNIYIKIKNKKNYTGFCVYKIK